MDTFESISETSKEEEKKREEEITYSQGEYLKLNTLAKEYPDKIIKMKLSEFSQMIPKKNAALEIYKELKINKMVGVGAIISALVIAVFSAVHVWAGAASACIITIFLANIVRKTSGKMSYFQEEYNLDPKT